MAILLKSILKTQNLFGFYLLERYFKDTLSKNVAISMNSAQAKKRFSDQQHFCRSSSLSLAALRQYIIVLFIFFLPFLSCLFDTPSALFFFVFTVIHSNASMAFNVIPIFCYISLSQYRPYDSYYRSFQLLECQ